MFKKLFVIASLLLGVGAMAQTAQTWPDKPVKLIVGWPAGGGTDIVARVWAKHMSKTWNQPVVIENRPGATGNVGSKHVLSQPTDGYTLNMVQTSAEAMMHTFNNAGYNWLTDFVPVAYSGDSQPFVLVVNSNSKINSFKEFEAQARAKTMTYGHLGTSSPHYAFSAALENHIGKEMINVPFKGTVQVLIELVGGRIDWVLTPYNPTLDQYIETNKLTVLATTANNINPKHPNAKTFSQLGIDVFGVRFSTLEVLAASGTPDDVVRKIRADSRATWPVIWEELRGMGVIDSQFNEWPASFEKLNQAQQQSWNRTIQKAKIKAE